VLPRRINITNIVSEIGRIPSRKSNPMPYGLEVCAEAKEGQREDVEFLTMHQIAPKAQCRKQKNIMSGGRLIKMISVSGKGDQRRASRGEMSQGKRQVLYKTVAARPKKEIAKDSIGGALNLTKEDSFPNFTLDKKRDITGQHS